MTAPRWMRPKDIAAALGISEGTARQRIRRIPGAELLYRTDTGRERWRVSSSAWEAWRASLLSCA